MSRRRTSALVTGLLLAACNEAEDVNRALSRMIDQPRGETYGASTVFEDGRAMRPLPEGVVSREEVLGADVSPPVTREFLQRGRERFEITCATCHGLLGDGDSVVARNMMLRRPPSLHDPRIVAFTPAELHRVVVEGYGLMPPLRHHLSPADRWAVVAYLRALQLSQGVPIVALPSDVRAEALKSLE